MNKIIVIGGPTASGKTALAIRCAQKLGTDIISADSRQCYTEMTIGTAKPSAKELSLVTHHFINSHQLPQKVSAGVFAEYSTPILLKLLSEKGAAVIAGGTGLYIRALLEGLDNFPEVPANIRESINSEAQTENALEIHQNELKMKDPEWYSKIDLNNHRRIIRALEIIRTSNLPYSSFLQSEKQKWNAEIHYYFPDPDRKLLYERIEKRVHEMINNGLEKEVHGLMQWENHPALQTVGYKEFFSFFRGETDFNTTVGMIVQHTRNYAKRQWTWFRNQGDWTPLNPDSEAFQNGDLGLSEA